jgi:hypothetical protein
MPFAWKGIVKKPNSTVRFKLSAAQIAVLRPAISQLYWSYQARLQHGSSPFTYPFRIYPPPKGFDKGVFDQECMDKIIEIGKMLKTKSKAGGRVQMDTFQLRATAFAIRAYIDFLRLLRRQQRRQDLEVKARLHIDDKSFDRLKAESQPVIGSLERHMKRANRALVNAVGKERYVESVDAWKAHLRWMRLRIAYFKPLAKPAVGQRVRQRRDLDELMKMAERGIRNAGYKPPDATELRRIIRLYARYARLGRQGHWTIQFLLDSPKAFSSKYHLGQFVIDRLNPKELSRL